MYGTDMGVAPCWPARCAREWLARLGQTAWTDIGLGEEAILAARRPRGWAEQHQVVVRRREERGRLALVPPHTVIVVSRADLPLDELVRPHHGKQGPVVWEPRVAATGRRRGRPATEHGGRSVGWMVADRDTASTRRPWNSRRKSRRDGRGEPSDDSPLAESAPQRVTYGARVAKP